MVAAGREAVLRRFKEAGKDISGHIVNESVTTPSQWRERFNIKHGAVFGLSHGLTQLAAFRPPVRTGIPQLDSPEVDGLHFVGASTRPGNGVPRRSWSSWASRWCSKRSWSCTAPASRSEGRARRVSRVSSSRFVFFYERLVALRVFRTPRRAGSDGIFSFVRASRSVGASSLTADHPTCSASS